MFLVLPGQLLRSGKMTFPISFEIRFFEKTPLESAISPIFLLFFLPSYRYLRNRKNNFEQIFYVFFQLFREHLILSSFFSKKRQKRKQIEEKLQQRKLFFRKKMESTLLSQLRKNTSPSAATTKEDYVQSPANVFRSEKVNILLKLHQLRYRGTNLNIYWLNQEYYFLWSDVSLLISGDFSEHQMQKILSVKKQWIQENGRTIRCTLIPFSQIDLVLDTLEKRKELCEEHDSDTDIESLPRISNKRMSEVELDKLIRRKRITIK